MSGPVEGQPTFGSCWRVENQHQRIRGWNPIPGTDRHPMVCAEREKAAALRRRVSLRATPRTSVLEQSDPLGIWTPAFVTPYLDKEGMIMVRYTKAVPIEGFEGFVKRVFAGELPKDICDQFSEKLMIKDITGGQ